MLQNLTFINLLSFEVHSRACMDTKFKTFNYGTLNIFLSISLIFISLLWHLNAISYKSKNKDHLYRLYQSNPNLALGLDNIYRGHIYSEKQDLNPFIQPQIHEASLLAKLRCFLLNINDNEQTFSSVGNQRSLVVFHTQKFKFDDHKIITSLDFWRIT